MNKQQEMEIRQTEQRATQRKRKTNEHTLKLICLLLNASPDLCTTAAACRYTSARSYASI